MATTVDSLQQRTPEPAPLPPGQTDAAALLAANRTAFGLDVDGLATDLAALDPARADAALAAIVPQLSAVDQGRLAALQDQAIATAEPTALPTITITPVPVQTPAYTATPAYYTPVQAQAQAPAPANDDGPDAATVAADLTQMALDIVGIFEPTPFADGTNTVISAVRALGSLFGGDLDAAGGHALNGVLSAAGIFPYLGDAAKIAKIGRWVDTVTDAVRLAADNPAMRAALEPGLRAVHDAIQRLPADALNALPAQARESIEAMGRQLDEFFGAGTRGVVDTANLGQTLTINGRTVTIGAPPVTGTRASDGRATAIDAAGNEALLRRPGASATVTNNPDGTITYTHPRTGDSVRYDANGFPLFETVAADVYLPADRIVVGSRSTHFDAANTMLARQSDDQLRAAGFTDAHIADIRAGNTPDGYTWHHHQDVGRMQLVRTAEHETFMGGHTGGWSLWGDANRFSVD